MELDPYGLTDQAVPLDRRLDAFNRALEKHGIRDPHIMSYDLKVTPQVVIAFYELNLLDKDELEFLKKGQLDMGLISVLMNIEPEMRKRIYEELDEFLEDRHPVYRIVEFVNSGGGRMTIRDLYRTVERAFWGQVASYLRDTAILSGTINKKLRSMLVNITRYDASEKQLLWLERAILHDNDASLGVFTAPTFREKFPEAVEAIQEFIEVDKQRFARSMRS